MQDKKQDKKPLNAEGQPHGLSEIYYNNGQLFYKGNFIKGEWIGYFQWYNRDASIRETRFYAR